MWVFGEAFGGIFAPGLSWAFGAPGAVLFYCVAGGLLALPERAWATPRLGRLVLRTMGVYFLLMAVLQAWPGRGFWQGRLHGTQAVGTLTGMLRQMAQTSQPSVLSSWVSSFASFDQAHGWAVNLVLVVALGAIGVALCTARRRVVEPALVAALVLCLADWVLVQDLGFFGGVGTDPNSMLPMVVVLGSGYLAMVRVPATAPAPVVAPAAVGPPVPAGRWLDSLAPGYLVRCLAAIGAVAVLLVGAAPMALAATNSHADPLLVEAINGSPNLVDTATYPFTLTDQNGQTVSLQSLRGKTVALTFLDPVCTSDCPVIAQEFHQADTELGGTASRVEFVAIVANPIYRSTVYTRTFDQEQGLQHVANWHYLTGPLSALSRIWNEYAIQVETAPAGGMIAHTELAYVIDPTGRVRAVLDADPGPDAATQSSFATLLDQRIEQVATP